MDWFERLTGFRERAYEESRRLLSVEGTQLRSLVNERTYGIGTLELPSLGTLRDRSSLSGDSAVTRLKVSIVKDNVRRLHQMQAYAGALFQVASQFNLLEMTGPDLTPEHGVTRYEGDPTQGPACAIAAGAATIYRNYFAPVDDQIGQTRDRQIDALAPLGTALSAALHCNQSDLWSMTNGYALCTQKGLDAIAKLLLSSPAADLDRLRGLLCVGTHRGVEVADVGAPVGQRVSQVFCSALPVAYSRVSAPHWRAFATLILEAAYEATLYAAVDNASRQGSNVVVLTSLGGGAFGNDEQWIDQALRRALRLFRDQDLDVRIVCRGPPRQSLMDIANNGV